MTKRDTGQLLVFVWFLFGFWWFFGFGFGLIRYGSAIPHPDPAKSPRPGSAVQTYTFYACGVIFDAQYSDMIGQEITPF